MTRVQKIVQLRAFVGVDVGKAGGLAYLSSSLIDILPMPLILGSYFDHDKASQWLDDCLAITGDKLTAIGVEHVRGYNQGVTSAFTFGTNYGGVMSWSLIKCKHTILVEPIDWQSFGLGGGTGGDKAVSRQGAMAQWPMVDWPSTKKAQEGVADALYIAHLIANNPRATVHEASKGKKASKRSKNKKRTRRGGGTPKTLGSLGDKETL